MDDELQNLELHQSITINTEVSPGKSIEYHITRVPNGLIYRTSNGNQLTAVFVPYEPNRFGKFFIKNQDTEKLPEK